MNNRQFYKISGKKNGERLESRVLEEQIQDAFADGHRYIEIDAFGQHGIGGRLWQPVGDSKEAAALPVYVKINGHSGQRAGSLGYPNTFIEINGPASDDVGWLNAGAQIVVHGNATNGIGNAMAQGKIYIAGNIGARGMTMTKHNPRFSPPELWVLGSAGDYFGEFMAGGVAVICGFDAQTPDNVLGYRPVVGMVGGKVFVRGSHKGFSQTDAKIVAIEGEDWNWLLQNLKIFLKHINRFELFEELSDFQQWQLLKALTPYEKITSQRRSIRSFKNEVWDKELGAGGLIGDLTSMDRSPIPLITNGYLRRFVPVWENQKYVAPCEFACPSGIPVHKRWSSVREENIDEAINIALLYTPFPATICGYLCPNVCMSACTRNTKSMSPIDIKELGKASINAKLPNLPPETGKKIAIIGGGAAGISAAWQLRLNGHKAVVYDMAKVLGGKISSAIPSNRIPQNVISKELERITKAIKYVHLEQRVEKKDIKQLKQDFDFVVIAVGAQKPRIIPVAGHERMITALDFLTDAKQDKAQLGKCAVIIGAGNVGCDVATEAHRLGAEEITLIDVQEPASFGKERENAEAVGAKFQWPCFTKEITKQGVKLTTGKIIPADTVIISIGDAPDLQFLPDNIATERGFIVVNGHCQTTDPQVFAVGDAVKPGLLTDAVGTGAKAAKAIIDMLAGKRPIGSSRQMIDHKRISLEYFDSRITSFDDIQHCASQCSSCGICRDCGVCVAVCPQNAISRQEIKNDGKNSSFEYIVDETKCIGCGFCAGACPCGIWNLVENDPIE